MSSHDSFPSNNDNNKPGLVLGDFNTIMSYVLVLRKIASQDGESIFALITPESIVSLPTVSCRVSGYF